MAGNYDGSVLIDVGMNNSGIEKDQKQMVKSAKSAAMKLAAEYRKQGLSQSEAMKKAWSEIERTSSQSSKAAGESANNNIGGSIQNVVGRLGGLSTVIMGMCASITAAFATVAVSVTKMAVDSYANYEQLTGGVATLFKDSADKVAAYAENAFYTAAMSANAYMETVTSFSASLISSLGGDTAKAADIANMAMVDMADNANKMGTSLSLIQNAYQGFAKQNYTMLDNLKLGYGGTQAEMARLLKDAEAYSGIKYDINNLADVYSAIHAIQEKLGIAGATAAEAEGTISGSAAMMKASWENVLTAISGGGDLDKAINNLVYSVSKYFENIVPVVQRSLTGIGQLIEKIAPSLVQNVATALIRAIPSLLNAVYQMVIGLAKGIYQGIIALFSGKGGGVAKQLGEVAKATDEAAGSAGELAQNTEAAGKAAKKALAGFDELNILQSGGGASTGAGIATGAISGGAVTVGGTVEDALTPQLAPIMEKIKDLMAPLSQIDLSPAVAAFDGLGASLGSLGTVITDQLEWAWTNVLVPLATWTMEEGGPAAVNALSQAFRFLSAVLTPVFSGLQKLWVLLTPVFEFIGDTVLFVLEKWQGLFSDLADLFEEKGPKIEAIFSGIGEIIAVVWTYGIQPVLEEMQEKWAIVFDFIGGIVETTLGWIIDWLSGAIEFIAGVLTGDWERAWGGISEIVKANTNGMIGFLNAMIKAIVDGINFAIKSINKLSFTVPDWVPGIGGDTWGFNIPTIKAPQIPYLAQGAVLPANKPFLAMVGDQRHGTNVEAPLATIQEAVALVMEDYAAANIAGHEATVAVLRDILEAVLGIEIGDQVIGQAVQRYNTKMAVMKGGV